jgi:long-chain acyl-CoA synthetase
MFYRWELETPDQIYLRQPKALQWTEYTWRQVGDKVRRIASFLRSKNYPAGSRIAVWSSNSKDWPMVDLAIMLAGHISVPLYPGQDAESARYILQHSESQMIFLGAFDAWRDADAVLPLGMLRIAMLGAQANCDSTLEQVIANNPPFAESPIPDPDATFTIVYTSGTTGKPKGVMHSHATPGHVCPDLAASLRHETGNTRFFSYLPMSHAAERILIGMGSLYCNGVISFSESMATFGEELRSVQPQFFFSVPRLWLKFKEGVDAKIPPAAQGNLSPEQKAGIVRQLGLAEARMILTGAAPCPRDVQRWFIDLGMQLRDAYGMTENFIHGCGWVHTDTPEPGCVGRALGAGVEVKLSDVGEILFRSKGLMQGYYLEPEKTAEVLVDGWYQTGDSGRWDDQGRLWVTGRLSEVFKTTKGKFVSPINIEDLFGRTPLLGQFCVFGHGLDQPVVAATLSAVGRTLDRETLAQTLGTVLDEINAELPAWEKIAQLFIARDEWTIGNGFLTPTMKLKRKPIELAIGERMAAHAGSSGLVFE